MTLLQNSVLRNYLQNQYDEISQIDKINNHGNRISDGVSEEKITVLEGK